MPAQMNMDDAQHRDVYEGDVLKARWYQVLQSVLAILVRQVRYTLEEFTPLGAQPD